MRAVAFVVVLCLPAGASALEVWAFPSAPLAAEAEHTLEVYAADGETLVQPTVRARDGSVLDGRPAADGGWLVRYRAPRLTAPGTDVLTVTSRRGSGRAEIAIEPMGRVQLAMTVSPTPLLLDKGAHAEVRISARDAAGRPARSPLRLGASVGRLSAPEEAGPGEYRAVYTPPDEKFPQVAIVAALSVADGAFASVALPLAARVTVNGQGEPGATLQIVVDNQSFGPLTIGKDGRWAMPLVVPPGSRAFGTSTDKLGNQQKHEIDLHLPPFPRLMVFAVPAELPADGRAMAEIIAFSVEARGKRATPLLSADRGALSPPEVHGDGSTTWTFTAPSSTGPGKATLHTGGALTSVSLRPAPPLSIQVVKPAEPLPAGSEMPVPVEVRVRDAGGAPVSGAQLTATLAGGRVVRTREKAPGRYSVEVLPPVDPGRGSTTLRVEVSGMQPGAPRRVTLHAAKAGPGHAAAEAWVDDDLGLPVPGARVELEGPGKTVTAETDRFGTARLEVPRPMARHFRFVARLPSLPGVTALLDELTVGSMVHAVSGLSGRGVEAEREPPAESSGEGELPLVAAAPLDVRLSVEPDGRHLKVKLVDAAGRPATGQILYQASAGRLELVRPVAGGEAELRFTPPPDGQPGARYLLSVTESRTRVTAFTEVTPR
jgi:hypothetical protein